MGEKDLELLITLDAPQEEEEDPHYQPELEDISIDHSNGAEILEQNLFSGPAGGLKQIGLFRVF